MASTNITANVIRTIQADYMAAEIPTQSKLIASGAVTVDMNPPVKAGGNYYHVPEVLEFTTADAQIPDDDTEGTRNSLATSNDIGVVCRREGNISVKDSAEIASGENLNAQAVAQAPGYWAKRMNIMLYNAVKGCFATALNIAAHKLDTGTTLKRSIIPDIMRSAAIGDQWDKYSIWIMHSNQYAQAYSDGIVTYVDAGNFGERLLMTGEVPTIAGKQVVVDDTIVETDGSTYLCQPNALYLAFQSGFSVETQRAAHLGGGLWEHWMRAHVSPHVRRLSYQSGGGVNPTNSTLATGTSWALSTAGSTDSKLVKIFKVKFEN